MSRLWMLAALAVAGVADAASDQELKAAFEKAQKKGAVAIYEQRCDSGHASLYFPDSTGRSLAKSAAALAAMAALQPETSAERCPAGLDGQSRLLELYPDGTVKAH